MTTEPPNTDAPQALYLDLVGGISGDMTVAALCDLGAPLELLRRGLAGVLAPPSPPLLLSLEREQRHHISGLRFTPRPAGQKAGQKAGPETAAGHHHRTHQDIQKLLGESALPPGALRRALEVFSRLAAAEARVHGTEPDQVTFHEVGAWDSIADIVCAALALDHLGVDEIFCSPVPLGAGTVNSAHGVLPVPAPATLELLRGFPVVHGGPEFERTTPTGAAILAALARPAPPGFSQIPRAVGIGLGTRDDPLVPNLLRAVLGPVIRAGETAASGAPGSGGWRTETVACAEVNLDDTNPEWTGYLMERLLEAGALDVVLIPVHMKKNRPGTMLQVLYPEELHDEMLALLFSESTTLGVRYRSLERAVLPRREETVPTDFGSIRGKVARLGQTERFTPEFDSARAAARQHGVPLREVYRAAGRAFEDGTD
ncbi:MAG: nickel pincer cofactor biosynthesis protein LarC [Deltaproteobacteria bacterium]|nr:nickel pincer cofactor biosynthesis protein LarC [Deltaproteobacteria bacterium]